MSESSNYELVIRSQEDGSLYKFVHPVVYVVHDPDGHVGWFVALQRAFLI